MSKDRLTPKQFAENFLKVKVSEEPTGEDMMQELTRLVDERDRETRNMVCSEVIGRVEELEVALFAPEPTERDDPIIF